MSSPVNLAAAHGALFPWNNRNVFPAQHLRGGLGNFCSKRRVSINSGNAQQVELRRFGEKNKGKDIVHIRADIGVKDNRSHNS